MNRMRLGCEPDLELLTVLWYAPRPDRILTKLDDRSAVIKDNRTGQFVRVELLSCHAGAVRFAGVMGDLSGRRQLL